MQEIRCKKCGKLLGKIEGIGEIKCSRCGEINNITTLYEFLKDPKNIKKYYLDVLKSNLDSTLVIDKIKQR